MTSVAVNTYTHSVTYVADNILKSFKDIIRLSGLDPTKLVDDWESNMRALQTWLSTGDLEAVVLEIFDPKTDALVVRWDIDVVYSWSVGRRRLLDRHRTAQIPRSARPVCCRARPATACCCTTSPADRTSTGWGTGDVPLDRRHGAAQPGLDDRAQRPRRQRRILEEDLMLTVDEAFRKFKSRLELNDREQKNASARQHRGARLS